MKDFYEVARHYSHKFKINFEEALSDVYYSYIKNKERYKDSGNFKGFLYFCAKGYYTDVMRKKVKENICIFDTELCCSYDKVFEEKILSEDVLYYVEQFLITEFPKEYDTSTKRRAFVKNKHYREQSNRQYYKLLDKVKRELSNGSEVERVSKGSDKFPKREQEMLAVSWYGIR